MRTPRFLFVVVLGLMVAIVLAESARAEQAAELTPCLSACADNSPGWPTTVFPSSGKRMTAVFRLGDGEKFAKMSARWVVVDVGEATSSGNELAKADLELKSSRTGRFKYSQEAPLQPGKYRLEVQADGKPWKSADLTVVADPSPIEVKSAADLLPLKEGQTWEYDSAIEVGKGVSWPDGVSPGPDHKVHQRFAVTVGPKEEAGWRVDITVDGKLARQVWWQLTDAGLVLTQGKDGNKVSKVDPPQVQLPLPKQVPMFWTWQAKDGSEKRDCQMWGPLTVSPPGAKQVAGYLVITDSPIEGGNKTMAQVFVPGQGLMAEVDVTADKAGNLLQRVLIAVGGQVGYKITPNAALKGRMGRLVVQFPKDSKASGTPVDVYADAAMKERSEGAFGGKTFDLLPGKYWVSISGAALPVEIQSRSDTVVLTGVLKVESSGNTAVEVCSDKEGTKKLTSFFGSKEIGFPVGTFYVKISGKVEPVKIEEGKITEF